MLLRFLWLVTFLKTWVPCFTFLLGQKKQWFQTVLLWEPEALQVDEALSSDGVHVQAGCSEWHRHQVWRFLVLVCVVVRSLPVTPWKAQECLLPPHWTNTSFFQRESYRESTGPFWGDNATVWPLCSLTNCNSKAPTRGSENPGGGNGAAIERNPSWSLLLLLFLRSCAFLTTLASSSLCGLFQLYVSIPS